MAEAKENHQEGEDILADDTNQSSENANRGGGFKDNPVAGATINGATLPVPCYIDVADGKIKPLKANDQTKLAFACFAISNSTNGNPISIQSSGIVRGFSGLTPGARYYAQNTEGTIGTALGTFEVFVGIAVSATELLIQKGNMEFIGSQALSNGANTIPAAIQNAWRIIVVSLTGDAHQGDVVLSRFRSTGVVSSYIGSVPNFQIGAQATISGTTITLAGVGNTSSATGTAYYYK